MFKVELYKPSEAFKKIDLHFAITSDNGVQAITGEANENLTPEQVVDNIVFAVKVSIVNDLVKHAVLNKVYKFDVLKAPVVDLLKRVLNKDATDDEYDVLADFVIEKIKEI